MSDRIRAIHAAIEFIEDHLKDEISVSDIAAAAGYSLYHFIRTFNQVVHHTPYDYLIRRRLSEAARELVASNAQIIDISVDYQFNNPETFSRAFKRMFHIQPSLWRERDTIPTRFLMPPLSRDYLAYISQRNDLWPEQIMLEQTRLAGLMAQRQAPDGRLWDALGEILRETGFPDGEHRFLGVSHLPRTQDRASFYFLGIEIATPDHLSPPLVVQTLPAGTYARFTHAGRLEQRLLTSGYIYHTWLPQSEFSSGQQIEIEIFDHKPFLDQDSSWQVLIPLVTG